MVYSHSLSTLKDVVTMLKVPALPSCATDPALSNFSANVPATCVAIEVEVVKGNHIVVIIHSDRAVVGGFSLKVKKTQR